ncbi:hypothetical protein F3J20_24300 [Paraburkholderia sp. Cy-641]|uniref:hypothetical protein n=1 Tax=Paraburkholderia sp. Cy-641 TaxID=2608337 RepID=UPI00141F1093|nr:hypothetical protein [Paraburkholderia sp. Cy-641]NIF80472.1 hypothetical protein [Paraburkholderia sp. Cy-641]
MVVEHVSKGNKVFFGNLTQTGADPFVNCDGGCHGAAGTGSVCLGRTDSIRVSIMLVLIG